jgi:arylsulfatase
MRLVDAQFNKMVEALDRLDLWQNTVVIFTGDHGEMNGAHRLSQKANIPFEEAAIVNLTVCAPGGPQGQRTAAVGSHLDLAPTVLAFSGLSEEEIRSRYPHLKGRSLKAVMLDPDQDGPRGSPRTPGDGALFCWDALNALDTRWSVSGALKMLTSLGSEPSNEQDEQEDRKMLLHEAGGMHGAPDFSRRAYFRAISDGRHKLVRWFSPLEYANPATLDDLYAGADVALYDLESDRGMTRRSCSVCSPSCTRWCGTRSATTAARSTSTCSARVR